MKPTMLSTEVPAAPMAVPDTDGLTPDVRRILHSKAFRRLLMRRRRLSLVLTATICTIYFGFILAVAFFPKVLAIKIDDVMTLGIPLGLSVIISAIVLTGFYVSRANREFDALTAEALGSTA